MGKLKPQIDDYDQDFDKKIAKQITRVNLFRKTLTRQWRKLLRITDKATLDHKHEYYILFLNKRAG